MDRTIRNSYPTTSYNTTSNAYVYDYEYMALEEDRVRKQKVQEHRAIRQKEAVKRKSVVHRLKFVAAIAFVFAGCILTMVTNATVDRYRVNNNKLRTELSTLKNENLNLVSEMTDNTDLVYIEQQAKTRLGMVEPQGYQLKYIDVPKQSYTVQYAAADIESMEEGFGLTSFLGILKDIITFE